MSPNAPNVPYRSLNSFTRSAYLSSFWRSGENVERYEPLTVKSCGEKTPSVPKIAAVLPCSFIWSPNSCAFAASIQGRKTTSVSSVILLTSAEKSVLFALTESVGTSTPASFSFGTTSSAMPFEYALWSSITKTFFAFSVSIM